MVTKLKVTYKPFKSLGKAWHCDYRSMKQRGFTCKDKAAYTIEFPSNPFGASWEEDSTTSLRKFYKALTNYHSPLVNKTTGYPIAWNYVVCEKHKKMLSTPPIPASKSQRWEEKYWDALSYEAALHDELAALLQLQRGGVLQSTGKSKRYTSEALNGMNGDFRESDASYALPKTWRHRGWVLSWDGYRTITVYYERSGDTPMFYGTIPVGRQLDWWEDGPASREEVEHGVEHFLHGR